MKLRYTLSTEIKGNPFCRTMLCKRGLWRHAVSVRPSVTFVNSDKTSNHILRLFPPSSSQRILVYAHQTLWQYSDGGVECRWGRKKSRFWTNSWLSIDDWQSANNNCDRPPCSLSHRRRRISELCLSQHARPRRREENTTEFIYMQRWIWSGSSYITEDCARRIALLKLLADTKHRAAFLQQQVYLYFLVDSRNVSQFKRKFQTL